MQQFRPRYIFEQELGYYGLPSESEQQNIMSIVDAASTLIDEYCGRTDTDGNGSLVYTTYVERVLLQAAGRNIARVSFKPLVAITPTLASQLQASGALGTSNNYWTGAQANTITRPDTTLSPLLGASGRHGHSRRNEVGVYPDLSYGMNIWQLSAYFGGPPGFMAIDVSAIDFDSQTGELWVPAGIHMARYSELVVIYNAGFNPFRMPPAIKDACAALVRNMLARGGGVTGIRGLTGQGMVNVTFTDDLIDLTIQRWLSAYKNVIAM